MAGMFQRFLGKTSSSGSSGEYNVPVSNVPPENESASIESSWELKKFSDPSALSEELVVQPLNLQRESTPRSSVRSLEREPGRSRNRLKR
ncbi:Hypothetical protein FKW44_008420 [Caligus rogercresseyi]|uniref:Uncharacterized protein n=1 Tax=Caligus rogercresseyi TaxID=217165 RepID=A0A7T8QU91_CALRO|nr:Hypothetical protein FKW44_008420 [Caligus rogercresseyi]